MDVNFKCLGINWLMWKRAAVVRFNLLIGQIRLRRNHKIKLFVIKPELIKR